MSWYLSWSVMPSRTFSNTVIESNSAPFWNTYPMWERRSLSSFRFSRQTSFPSTKTVP